jgi:DNA-directed RNA polymerase subunit RPC12/RpoP
MTAITCVKCYRRFTPTVEEIRGYLEASKGQKHALVICPHCGKSNKVSPERLREAVRFIRLVPTAETPAAATTEQPSAPATAVTEQPLAAEIPTAEQSVPEGIG